MTSLKVFAAGTLFLMMSVAQAQYAWIDDKGVKQFSDRAPPATVPLNKILKSPRPMKNMAGEDQTPAAPVAPAKPALSVAEREADYRKRAADKAAQQKEASDKAGVAAQRTAACNQARAAKDQLSEGRRLRAADGSFLDDEQRAAQTERANATLQECAKSGT